MSGQITPTEESALAPNDHRRLGRELDLFTFSDVVGKGLPLYTDKGATVRRELERFVVEEELKRGYKHVITPDIAKLDLYRKSGHYPYYQDSMYAPIVIDEEEFMLRPMTCPHHFEFYLSRPRSYRELPMRIAEIAKLYRYELSGVLTGIERTRSFCLTDGHIICANPAEAAQEIEGALSLITFTTTALGLVAGEDYWFRLSLGNRGDEKKYFKDDAAWDEAEELLRSALRNQGVEFVEALDEAAFYGPKIDIQMRDMRGKEDTAFTVQYDFVMPGRFGLRYVGEDGQEHTAVVVHRSSIGSIERILAFLIEKYRGAFPIWLAPVQVAILPIGEGHREYAEGVAKKLREAGIRVELDASDESLGKRIRAAKIQKTPYLAIIGDKEIETRAVTVEPREGESLGALTPEDFLSRLQAEIAAKK